MPRQAGRQTPAQDLTRAAHGRRPRSDTARVFRGKYRWFGEADAMRGGRPYAGAMRSGGLVEVWSVS